MLWFRGGVVLRNRVVEARIRNVRREILPSLRVIEKSRPDTSGRVWSERGESACIVAGEIAGQVKRK